MSSKSLTSPEGDAKKLKNSRRWRKLGRGAFWTLVIVFLIHSTISVYASVLLNRELAAIRQKGEPLQFSELKPPPLAPAQNAALLYQQATASLRLSVEEKNAFLTRQRSITPAIEKVITGALANNQRALSLTRQAGARPGCDFGLDWDGDPTRLKYSYFSELRALARMLAADAKYKARNGDAETALRDTRAMFGMSRHLSQEPNLIGFLVHRSVDGIGQQALAGVLDHVSLSVAQARAFETSLPQTDWQKSFRSAFLGERAMGIYAFEHVGLPAPIINDDESVGFFPPVPSFLSYPLLWLWRPVLKLDEVQSLRLWERLLNSPQIQQFPTSANFAAGQRAAIRSVPSYAVLTRILFPVFTSTSETRDGAQTRQLLQEVALALTCYRTQHGAYPATLDPINALWGKPLPLDPYTEKAFLYRREGDSFTLYSVGINRKDDKGKYRNMGGMNSYSNTDDIVWMNTAAMQRDFRSP